MTPRCSVWPADETPRLFNVRDVDPWADDDPPRLGPTPGCEACRRWGYDSTCPGCFAMCSDQYAYLLMRRIESEDQDDRHTWPLLMQAIRSVLDLIRHFEYDADDEYDADQIRRTVIAQLEGSGGR